MRRALRATPDHTAINDLLFLEAWEMQAPPDIASTLRASQIRRANPLLAEAIRAELSSAPRPPVSSRPQSAPDHNNQHAADHQDQAGHVAPPQCLPQIEAAE